MATFYGSSFGGPSLQYGGTITGDLTVTHDLNAENVNCTLLTATTTITEDELEVKDQTITMAFGALDDTKTTALMMEYVASGRKWAGLGRSAENKEMYLFKDATSRPDADTDVRVLTGATLHAATVYASVIDVEASPLTIGVTPEVIIIGAEGVSKSLWCYPDAYIHGLSVFNEADTESYLSFQWNESDRFNLNQGDEQFYLADVNYIHYLEANSTAHTLNMGNAITISDVDSTPTVNVNAETTIKALTVSNEDDNESYLVFNYNGSIRSYFSQFDTSLVLQGASGTQYIVCDLAAETTAVVTPFYARTSINLVNGFGVTKWKFVENSGNIEIRSADDNPRIGINQTTGLTYIQSLATGSSLTVGTLSPSTQWVLPNARATAAGKILVDLGTSGLPTWGQGSLAASMSDTAIVSPQDNNVLRYNSGSSKWVASTPNLWQSMAFGGTSSVSSTYYRVNGFGGQATSTLDYTNQAVSLVGGTIVSMGYSSVAGDTTTTMAVVINGVIAGTFMLPANNVGRVVLGYAVALSDLVAISWIGVGTNPGGSVFTLMLAGGGI